MEKYQNNFSLVLHGKAKFPVLRKTAKLSWDWKELRRIHPAMKAENLLENVLKPGITGNHKEAACLQFRGDPMLLVRAIGTDSAKIIFEAQEAKEASREASKKAPKPEEGKTFGGLFKSILRKKPENAEPSAVPA